MAQLAVLEACASLDPMPTVVVAGSSDEYGAPEPADNPVGEDQDLVPRTPYGVTKVVQDLMARQYWLAKRMPTVVVRPFLQIGPGRSDRFFSGTFARQVVGIERGLRPPVIEVGDIDRVRDMTDVRDVARACVLVATAGNAGQAYNVSTGAGRPVRDLLDAMVDLSGIEPEVRVIPGAFRDLEPQVLVGDSSKLRAQTGWAPRIPLVDSARDMLEERRSAI